MTNSLICRLDQEQSEIEICHDKIFGVVRLFSGLYGIRLLSIKVNHISEIKMAKRPIFVPTPEVFPFVKEKLIEFEWHPGFAKVQAQKSIRSLHEAAARSNLDPVLEISSKSLDTLGVDLSAFNLKLLKGQHILSVECAYQGSKVFTGGGPFTELYYVSSIEAKKDERIRNSGNFVGYRFFEEEFPANPVTAFYDWLYLTALSHNPSLSEKLLEYKSFSDIAFNPKKSLNCQARAAALFVSLSARHEIQNVLEDKAYYLTLINSGKVSKMKKLEQKKDNDESSQIELFL